MDLAQLCSENSAKIHVKSVIKLLNMNSSVDVDTVFLCRSLNISHQKIDLKMFKSQPHSL